MAHNSREEVRLDRTEIEIKLNRDRAWLLETYATMPSDLLERGVTRSEHDAETMWSAKDHLVHLAGIEHNFVRMIRRHLGGASNPVGLREDDQGNPRSREEIMAGVHAMTEDWANRHRGKSLSELIAVGQKARAETLLLLSELSDDQLAETLPGAPWSDGTIGGVLAVNADHGRMHYQWVKEGFSSAGIGLER
jgi:hypothetical protein